LEVCNGTKIKKSRKEFYTSDDPNFRTCKIASTVQKVVTPDSDFTDPILEEQLNHILPSLTDILQTKAPSMRFKKFQEKRTRDLLKQPISLDVNRHNLMERILRVELKDLIQDALKAYASTSRRDEDGLVNLVLVPDAFRLVALEFGEEAVVASSQVGKSVGEWTREVLDLRDTLKLGVKVREA
ncbi:hypothetical protein HDU67_008976, partial [Dinochytrium kinnereticum]